ncbi:MAG: FecR domain-containing protein [Sphingobacteriales bacterium]|nr:FecR domain-containing protein [Sphingobacteriales bacterium]OJW01209.1 MAG: hypothetical protein BGO52_07190 [Sphingobacteriales bacterium 44-61]
MTNERLAYLFDRFLQEQCSPEENRELSALVLNPQHEEQVRALLGSYWSQVVAAKDSVLMPDEEAEKMLEKMFHEPLKKAAPVKRMRWRRIAVAASILLAVALGSYLVFFQPSKETKEVVKVEEPAKDVKAPETNRAMITLADGSTVYLDSANNGQLAMQGNVKLVKLSNGQIAYETTGGDMLTEMKYNTLSNPRGSKVIDMALADGSHVWLNAGSSVTYPIAFIGNERNVTITGEAYFEVTTDKSKPFKVSKGDVTVQVLGTHFNVNAYDDEDNIKVTLLEGSVKVSKGQSSLNIKPNQQAVVNTNTVSLNTNVDVDLVMAWKNGYFKFNRTDLKIIMREIARWYDVEVNYEGNVPLQLYNGDVPRNVNVSEVLKVLEYTGAHFKIEGKKVTVLK